MPFCSGAVVDVVVYPVITIRMVVGREKIELMRVCYG